MSLLSIRPRWSCYQRGTGLEIGPCGVTGKHFRDTGEGGFERLGGKSTPREEGARRAKMPCNRLPHSVSPFPEGPAEAGRCWWSTPRYSTPASMTSSVSLGRKSSFQGLWTWTCAHQAQEGQGPELQRHNPSPQAPVAQLSLCSLWPQVAVPREGPLFVSHYISLGLGKRGRLFVCLFFLSKYPSLS